MSQFFGLFRGIVVNRKDPKKQLRVRVSCPQVFGDLEESKLPWAYPRGLGASTVDGSNSHGGSGLIHVPKKGSPVYVEFEGGDPRYPVWSHGWFGADTARVKAAKNLYGSNGEPDNHAWITPRGTSLQLDDRPGKEKIIMRLPEGDVICMQASGDTEMTSKRSVKVRAPMKVEVTSTRAIEIKAPSIAIYAPTRLDILSASIGITSSGPLNIRGVPLNINGVMLPPQIGTTAQDLSVNTSQKGD